MLEDVSLLSKNQIDKVGDRLREGAIDADAIRALETYRAEYAGAYKAVERVLRDSLGHAVTGRPAKSTIAIIEKLKRQKTRLTQIQDIAGCRVVVGNVPEQDSLVSAASVMFPSIVVDDKRATPTHGYRAVHLIISISGKPVEVQVRTNLQHLWAEISEKVADTYGHEIKYGDGNAWALDILNQMSSRISKIERLHLKRILLERQILRMVDRKLFRRARKRIEEVQLAIRLEFYQLRRLIQQIGA